MKKTTIEVKNTLEEIDRRLDNTEDWIGDWGDKAVGTTQAEQKIEKRILKMRIL